MKNLTLFMLCLFANVLFGQTKFKNEKLTLVQDVYYNSTKQNLNSMMENKGYTVGEVEKGEGEYGDSHIFNSKLSIVSVEYTPKGAMFSVVMMYSGAVNNTFIEMDIEDAGFTSKDHEMTVEGKTFIKKQWSKKGEKHSFVTYSDDEEKIGFLGYGTFED